MKNLTCFLAVAALAGSVVGIQTDRSTFFQPAAESAPHPGIVLKQLPFRIGHPHLSGTPRIKSSIDNSDATSGNWSGYASLGATFTDVTGSWLVPGVTGTAGKDAYTATWVGLDGYSDNTVEQTGTLQEWTGNGQANYPWFEMYPGPMYEIESTTVNGKTVATTVNVGDIITAIVSYVGTTTEKVGRKTETEDVFSLTLSDTAASGALNWTVTVGPSTGEQSYTTIPAANRTSAEWIMEAPTSSDILPLADFGTDIFDGCAASTGTVSGPIDTWSYQDITMEDPEGGESTPSALVDDGGVSAFTVNYSAYSPPPAHGGHGGR